MAKQPGHPSDIWPETWRLHAELPPAAAALLMGAALDLDPGTAREAMQELAALLTQEREWLGLYANDGAVLVDMNQAAADEHLADVERFEALWTACGLEATAALAPFLPDKKRF